MPSKKFRERFRNKMTKVNKFGDIDTTCLHPLKLSAKEVSQTPKYSSNNKPRNSYELPELKNLSPTNSYATNRVNKSPRKSSELRMSANPRKYSLSFSMEQQNQSKHLKVLETPKIRNSNKTPKEYFASNPKHKRNLTNEYPRMGFQFYNSEVDNSPRLSSRKYANN